jgi:hypothetical protein
MNDDPDSELAQDAATVSSDESGQRGLRPPPCRPTSRDNAASVWRNLAPVRYSVGRWQSK